MIKPDGAAASGSRRRTPMDDTTGQVDTFGNLRIYKLVSKQLGEQMDAEKAKAGSHKVAVKNRGRPAISTIPRPFRKFEKLELVEDKNFLDGY